MTGSDLEPRIRVLQSADLAAVMRIERSVYPAPWPEEHLVRVAALPGAIGRVAEIVDGEVAGYALGWVAADEAELANIAVAPEHRRSGVASRLLDSMREAAVRGGAGRMYLEVRASNTGAQGFYRARGFTVTGRRRQYYSRPREDALTMAVDLTRGGT